MAITGADFVCRDTSCKHTGTGFTMSSVWPLGDIDKVIEVSKDNKEYTENMLRLKKEGRRHACIKLPNASNIPITGYRIQKWCDSCKSLKLFDALKTFPEMTMEEAIGEADYMGDIAGICTACSSKLKTFAEVTDKNGNGISCPSCNTRMKMTSWFANEKEN